MQPNPIQNNPLTRSSWLQRLFGRGEPASRSAADSLYAEIVAAARQPEPYAAWQVPDTPLGRFEMMALHLFLLLDRVRDEPGAGEVTQTLVDEFFAEVDSSVRELGVGDAGVPKRVRKLAKMFYGRAASYGKALAEDDQDALAAALARNIRPDAASWPEAGRLTAYVRAAHESLRNQATPDLLAGRVSFPQAGGIA